MLKWIVMLSVSGWCFLLRAGPVRAQALPTTMNVAMPDGVTLATDVWRPLLDATPRPVLLRRTPYGRAVDLTLAQNLVNAGYVLVSQDVRGRGNSTGVFEPFFDDKVDGKATIDWIAKQSWSNGRVGTYSNSAEGIVQYMAMAAAPEALRCAHLGVPTRDLYASLLPGGAWRTDLGTNWLTGLGAASVVDLWKSHEVRDSYWDDATLSNAEMAVIDHPVFVIGGMFDIFAADEVQALRDLQDNVNPKVRDDVFLVMGPWTHGGQTVRQQGELLYPMEATYVDYATDLVAYFDYCLRDGPRPKFPAVRYYLSEVSDQTMLDSSDNKTRIVASGEWRSVPTWPLPEAQFATMYLHEDDHLSGELPTSDAPEIRLKLDPADPLASLGGGNLSTPAGPYDQSALDARPDVYTVQTEPVTDTVEIVGNVRAQLWAASATTDVDVIARLEVLTPMGKAVAFTDGILRGRFVQGDDAIRPLVPDQPALFDFELGPTALRLPAGYALRIAISGASVPRYEANPNVATPLASKPATVATTLTLFRDAAHPSRLRIPVLAGRLPGTVDEPDSDGGASADAGPDSGASASGDAASGTSQGGAGAGSDATTDVSAPDAATDARASDGCGCHLGARSRSPVLPFGLVLLGTLVWVRRRRGR